MASPRFHHSATARKRRGGGDGRRCCSDFAFHHWLDSAVEGGIVTVPVENPWIGGLSGATASVKPSRLASGRRFRLRSERDSGPVEDRMIGLGGGQEPDRRAAEGQGRYRRSLAPRIVELDRSLPRPNGFKH